MPIFIVHEHHAKRAGLHYDLRLEIDGVLKSWAFRKPPPGEVGIKRLGIQQSDHELSYAVFEGIIPAGYGAGIVKIWDKGGYKLLEYAPDKKIEFEAYGQRLKGRYVMLAWRRGWLFFKAQ